MASHNNIANRMIRTNYAHDLSNLKTENYISFLQKNFKHSQ